MSTPRRSSEPAIPARIVLGESPRSSGEAPTFVASTTLSRFPRAAIQLADDALGRTRAARPVAPVCVGRVDEVATRLDIGVEHREGALLVDRPAEHVAAEAQWKDVEVGVPEARDAPSLASPAGYLRLPAAKLCTGGAAARMLEVISSPLSSSAGSDRERPSRRS